MHTVVSGEDDIVLLCTVQFVKYRRVFEGCTDAGGVGGDRI